MIRSSYGIKLIDRVSKITPWFWDFLADFSVLCSFAGVGGYYLSVNHKTRRNLYVSLSIVSAAFCIASFYFRNPFYGGVFLFLFLSSVFALPKFRSHAADFMQSALTFSAVAYIFFDGVTATLIGVFGVPAAMIYLLFSHGMNILSSTTDLPGVSPMLPSSRDGNLGVSFPGYDLFIPWWHALVALFVTLVFHEGAHGVLVRRAGVRLKSTGILSFLSLPIGAFVEPDEKQLNAKSSVDRMRVYTMGSFANLLVGSVAALLILAAVSSLGGIISSDGMKVVGITPGYPAEGVIPTGAVIHSINGVSTKDFALYKNLSTALKPGMNVSVNTSEGAYYLTLAEDDDEPGRGLMGVSLLEDLSVKGDIGSFLTIPMIAFALESLSWIVFFNINIGLVNLLPIVPFDGGRMLKEISDKMRISKVNANRVLYAVISFTALMFLVNMIPLARMMFDFFL